MLLCHLLTAISAINRKRREMKKRRGRETEGETRPNAQISGTRKRRKKIKADGRNGRRKDLQGSKGALGIQTMSNHQRATPTHEHENLYDIITGPHACTHPSNTPSTARRRHDMRGTGQTRQTHDNGTPKKAARLAAKNLLHPLCPRDHRLAPGGALRLTPMDEAVAAA